MIDILEKVDAEGSVESSCFVRGKEIEASTFPDDMKKHEKIGIQAFSYVFANVAKAGSGHKESHIEIGAKRLSGFIVGKKLMLICMSDKQSSILKIRQQAKVALIELRLQKQS